MATQRNNSQRDVYLEIGSKRTFAGAIDWPGWCRSGRDMATALQSLIDYKERYAQVLHAGDIAFDGPAGVEDFNIIERLVGTSTTDFGAPDVAPSGDSRPFDLIEKQRLQKLLEACWQAFDNAVKLAEGKELRKGPRGGGRDLQKIIQHVLGAEEGYLSKMAWKKPAGKPVSLGEQVSRTRQAILDALERAVRGEIPAQGPRGGAYWLPRYFVRRVAWHVLDHTWEIEDRVE